jgi:hypothetical protein
MSSNDIPVDSEPAHEQSRVQIPSLRLKTRFQRGDCLADTSPKGCYILFCPEKFSPLINPRVDFVDVFAYGSQISLHFQSARPDQRASRSFIQQHRMLDCAIGPGASLDARDAARVWGQIGRRKGHRTLLQNSS